MPHDLDLPSLTRLYPADCQPLAGSIEPLGPAGGFSGARFWRFRAPRGLLCLRRWPREHPTAERLERIHAVLQHVERAGFRRAAVPVATLRGETFVQHAGHLWELGPWMPGRADYHQHPSPQRLAAAMQMLASFHRAAACFRADDAALPAASPGLVARRQQLNELLANGVEPLAAAIQPAIWPELAEQAARWLALFPRAAPRVSKALDEAATCPVPLQPCLRDIWHDHVLFEGNEVSGLVDFGAMRMETVAGDLARLLGSLAGDDAQSWQRGIEAYESVRPLLPAERRLIAAFDASSVLLSTANWFQWVFVEQRTFAERITIVERIEAQLARLTHLVEAH